MENKKSLVALALVALVGMVGATFAYFTSGAKLTNEFTTGTYSTSVKEEFISPDNWTPGTTTTKKVNVTNNGNVDVSVRAIYTEKWTAKDGTVLSGVRDEEKVAQFNIGSDWERSVDGYYYYKESLSQGETSNDFISSVTFNPNFILEEGTDIECVTTKESGKTTVNCTNLDSGYAGATYSLDITIETIQADQTWKHCIANGTCDVGAIIAIENETFNVISDNGETITMLAKYNLGATYKQSAAQKQVKFSNSIGWDVLSDIDIQSYDGPVKTYINEYVTYLQETTGDYSIVGNLITLSQLKSLGCIINDDYSYTAEVTCANSNNINWLANGQMWWTRSSHKENTLYIFLSNGTLGSTSYDYSKGRSVRPVITISKDTLANL